ncbi:C40 family peptidase [Streptomyces lavendulae]|uniref:Uncharacterized protein n=1 Tax=Streptomyces lavendulae subsp. lavendulae TaxID=58340 RepID=A0A2K8PAR7_STRLA|nr:C40 family peptidase [Streptomyces lavendulae]ATZ23568.1 hypothetical protein SLAV_08485 [Streptomyces lavendulae subsp. lavendulae]QUQ53399.1 hypothetical protein SLLC_06515 [Streptomyces lavendulae subsp. lavendulae]
MSVKTSAFRAASIVTAACAASLVLSVMPAHADSIQASSASVSSTGSLGNNAAPGGKVSRTQAISRAQVWVDKQVPYSTNGLTSPYSWWSDDRTGGRYRQDCSGFVSMAWQLSYSRTTYDLPDVSTQISKWDLQPGDILNSNDHVVLFAGWRDKSAGTFNYYQESSRSRPTNYNTDGNLYGATLSSHPTSSYSALRYKNITDDVANGGDLPVAGNWDGGPAGNVGVWRDGKFHLRNDDGSLAYVDWGQAGDLPVSANWDGAGPDNVGVFRPSTGQFHLRMDDGSLKILDWGQAGDTPVAGNWDGGPAANIGIWRNGTFHLRNDDGSLLKIDWGQAGDLPVTGNWDGAGPDNLGVFRPSTGQFHLRMDDGSLKILDWGQAGDLPVSANWDGGNNSPAANIGIWRPSEARFHLRNDDGTLAYLDWGQPR